MRRNSESATKRLAGEKSERFQIGGRQAPIASALDFERHFLIFSQILQTGTLDGRDVHENVFGAVFGGNEAKTFSCVEELDGAGLHGDPFQ